MIEDEYPQKITKLQAAERQLREAIYLFISLRDSVSVHTLAGAAHQILEDLCKSKSLKGPIQSKLINENYQKVWKQAMRDPMNFFKHADSDPNGIVTFKSEFTQFVLFDAIYMYEQLSEASFSEIDVYKTWFATKFPGVLGDENLEKVWIEAKERTGLSHTDYKVFQDMLNEKASKN